MLPDEWSDGEFERLKPEVVNIIMDQITGGGMKEDITEQNWEKAVVQIQEGFWIKVREEIKKILVENPEIRAKFLDNPSPTAEEDFLDMMVAMMKEDAEENEDVLDA